MGISVQNLLDFDAGRFSLWFSALQEKPFRATQTLRWLHRIGASDFDAMTDLAKSLREKLKTHATINPPVLAANHRSQDGSRKFLFNLDDANAVEAVFIPEGGRGTLCVSTQAGCALECAFCATGKQGFSRNLTTAEIIGQLWQANRFFGHDPKGERIISNVVLMGMGEPLANLDNLIPALNLMLDDNAYGLSRRRVTVSTVGLIPGMDRLREECPVALAVSLHAANDALRDELMPINRKYPLFELMDACRRYLEKAPRDFVTFEYVLLSGINDGDADARALLALTRKVSCKFNIIPFNPFPGSEYRRPGAERIRRFTEILLAAGKVATTRKTRGRDITAACGQLAGQVRDKRASSRRVARVNRQSPIFLEEQVA